jgi:hypothetical protein
MAARAVLGESLSKISLKKFLIIEGELSATSISDTGRVAADAKLVALVTSQIL